MNRKPAGKPLIREEKRFPQRGQYQSGRISIIPGGDGTYPAGFVLSPAGTMPIRQDKRFPRRGQSKSERRSVVPAIKKPLKKYSIHPSLKMTIKNQPSFHFLPAKVAPCPLGLGKAGPLKGLAGEKSSSLRCGIFPRQALRNPDTEATRQVRNRNTGSKSRSRFNH